MACPVRLYLCIGNHRGEHRIDIEHGPTASSLTCEREGSHHEAYISAKRSQTEAQSWISCAHGNRKWPEGVGPSQSPRPSSPVGVIHLQGSRSPCPPFSLHLDSIGQSTIGLFLLSRPTASAVAAFCSWQTQARQQCLGLALWWQRKISVKPLRATASSD